MILNLKITVPILSTSRWISFPFHFTVAAFGLFIVAMANNAARQEHSNSTLLFWVGLLLIYLPIASRLASDNVSRLERIGLIIVLGFTLYLVKILNSPGAFTNYDELLQWRTVDDISVSGYLFSRNPLHNVGSLYPGLANITSALINITGLDVFRAGILIIGAIRLVFMVMLYLLFEQLSQSELVASLAVLLYVGNPQFLFFNAMFSYESLALLLGLTALVLLIQKVRDQQQNNIGPTVIFMTMLASLTITHHVTSYMVLIFLLVWIAVAALFRRKQEIYSLIPSALLLLVMSISWLIFIADITVGYLGGNLIVVLREVLEIIIGDATTRQLFSNAAGYPTPRWEQLTAFVAVALTAIGLPFGIIHIWKNQRDNILALTFAIVSLAYFLLLLLRLTNQVATVNRVFAFIYITIVYVLAWGIVGFFLPRIYCKLRVLGITAYVTIIFLGGVIVGWAPWGRLPGPYLVVADSRSIEPEGITAAKWARNFLGDNNRIGADRINATLMLVYGRQYPVTKAYEGFNVSELFMSSDLSEIDPLLLKQAQLHYIVVDQRITTALPPGGVYFELGEQNAHKHKKPIDPATLSKFDYIKNVDRVFDSGNIIIYDIETLSNEP